MRLEATVAVTLACWPKMCKQGYQGVRNLHCSHFGNEADCKRIVLKSDFPVVHPFNRTRRSSRMHGHVDSPNSCLPNTLAGTAGVPMLWFRRLTQIVITFGENAMQRNCESFFGTTFIGRFIEYARQAMINPRWPWPQNIAPIETNERAHRADDPFEEWIQVRRRLTIVLSRNIQFCLLTLDGIIRCVGASHGTICFLA